jgi:hypothetical protein
MTLQTASILDVIVEMGNHDIGAGNAFSFQEQQVIEFWNEHTFLGKSIVERVSYSPVRNRITVREIPAGAKRGTLIRVDGNTNYMKE